MCRVSVTVGARCEALRVRTVPRLLTSAQVAKLCYVSSKTVDNLRRRGQLEALPIGSQYRFPATQDALRPFLTAAGVTVAP